MEVLPDARERDGGFNGGFGCKLGRSSNSEASPLPFPLVLKAEDIGVLSVIFEVNALSFDVGYDD